MNRKAARGAAQLLGHVRTIRTAPAILSGSNRNLEEPVMGNPGRWPPCANCYDPYCAGGVSCPQGELPNYRRLLEYPTPYCNRCKKPLPGANIAVVNYCSIECAD